MAARPRPSGRGVLGRLECPTGVGGVEASTLDHFRGFKGSATPRGAVEDFAKKHGLAPGRFVRVAGNDATAERTVRFDYRQRGATLVDLALIDRGNGWLVGGFGACKSLLAGANRASAANQPHSTGLQVVRSVRGGRPLPKLTAAQKAQARRIIPADPLLHPLLRDAGGFVLGAVGPVTADDPRRLLGAFTRVRLSRSITGTYRLPAICYDLKGRPVSLGPIRFALLRVSRLDVEVGLASGAVIDVADTNGTERLAPGAHRPRVPHRCARESRRSRGD